MYSVYSQVDNNLLQELNHIVFVFRNIFSREMESDIKGPTCFDHNHPCFFPGTRGMTWALATALLTKLRR